MTELTEAGPAGLDVVGVGVVSEPGLGTVAPTFSSPWPETQKVTLLLSAMAARPAVDRPEQALTDESAAAALIPAALTDAHAGTWTPPDPG